MLSEALASAFARVALANIEREFPRKLDHLLMEEESPRSERERHPAFYGSFDWHSAVHMHWTLLRVLHLYPMLPENGQIAAALDRHLSADALAAELDYFRTQRTFERPYGWAWLLKLQAEALRAKARWSRALEPLSKEISSRMTAYVAESAYPVRAGTHGNTAFACILALDYARTNGDLPLEMEIRKAARRWYGSDRDAPLAYEPSADDFLSPSLIEALLMKEIMDSAEFGAWLLRFLPDGIGKLAEPPVVADRSDPKQSHLDGLCFTRAWCLGGIGLHGPAEKLIAAALPHVAGGDYAGEHWLASFAVLALGGLPTAAARTTP